MTEGLAVEPPRGSLGDPLRGRDEPSPSQGSCAQQHEAGDLIGGFRILERIDQGVEASLFRVERVARPRSPLAAYPEQRGVLVLASARRGRVDPDRFAEQARRLAGVEHRALAPPRHGGVTSDGRVWVVYDEIVGTALGAYCDARALALEARVRWMIDVLGALARAHAQLVLHGYLAPELLRIVEGEEGPAVVVLGFGLQGLAGSRTVAGDEPDSREAPPSALASPEEVLAQPRSASSDVYRVGLELQRLLLGARPEDDQFGDAPESWVRAMVERSMSDPAESFAALPADEQQRIAGARGTSPRALLERLRGELGEILRATLAEEATERPSSADALALRLERWLEDQGSGSSRRRVGRGVRVIVAAALLVLAAGTFTSWQRAERASTALRLDAAVDRALVETLAPAWPGDLGTQEVVPPALAQRLAVAPAGLAVALLGRSAEIAAEHGDRERATALHALATERAVAAFGEGSPEVAASRLRRARTAVALGLADAGTAAREALAAVRATRWSGFSELVEARLLMAEATVERSPADALGLAGELVAELEAPAWWRRALGGAPWNDADRDRHLLRARLVRGRALLAQEHFTEAATVLAAAAQSPAAGEPRLVSEAWRLVATATERAGAPAAARAELLEGALQARIEAAGERDPVALELAERLATVLAAAGRLEGAIARAARTAELAAEVPVRARSWEQVGRWQVAAARPAEAAASFDAAFELLEPSSEDGYRVALQRVDARLRAGDVASASAALGDLPSIGEPEAQASGRVARARVLAALGRAEAAVALRQALESLQTTGSGEAPAAVPALLALGELLLEDGDAIVAEAYLRRAVAILESSESASFRIAEARSALGEALLAQGRQEEARVVLQDAAGALAGRDDLPAREARRRLGLLGGGAIGS
ncbi:MAG TPA: hypothetical protein VMV46_00165 [Thermoanaerobaculia bacterium]|nr:hypothetical protein [Thermoanaerobaculia bacterium]